MVVQLRIHMCCICLLLRVDRGTRALGSPCWAASCKARFRAMHAMHERLFGVACVFYGSVGVR